MTDTEARVFVARAVAEALHEKWPGVDTVALGKAAVLLVDVVINEYLRCRMQGTQERKPS